MLTSKPQSEPMGREVAGLIVFCILIYVVWCAIAPALAKLAVHS